MLKNFKYGIIKDEISNEQDPLFGLKRVYVFMNNDVTLEHFLNKYVPNREYNRNKIICFEDIKPLGKAIIFYDVSSVDVDINNDENEILIDYLGKPEGFLPISVYNDFLKDEEFIYSDEITEDAYIDIQFIPYFMENIFEDSLDDNEELQLLNEFRSSLKLDKKEFLNKFNQMKHKPQEFAFAHRGDKTNEAYGDIMEEFTPLTPFNKLALSSFGYCSENLWRMNAEKFWELFNDKPFVID